MSLNFLSPAFLWGLLGLSVPILIHLLTRRHQTHLPFSAVYLLRQAQTRSVRRSRPNRRWLLLLRCLALAALSLALAGPVFSLGGAEDFLPGRPSATAVILDDSYSMSAEAGEGTLFQRALQGLQTLLAKMPADHDFFLVRASAPARAMETRALNAGELAEALQTLRPTYQTTDIGPAVALARDLLSASPHEVRRILLLTDRDRNGWNPETFPSDPPPFPGSFRLVDFSPLQTRDNQAMISALETHQEFLTHNRMVRVRATVDNLRTDRALADLRIALVVGGKTESEDTLSLPAGGRAVKEFTFPYLGRDAVRGYVEIQDDGLKVDNRRQFSFQPESKIRVLVVDGDPGGVPHQHESFYLEKALNPFGTADSEIVPTISTLDELPRRNLDDFTLVLLSNVRSLPFGYEHELERFVTAGGALFIGLGDQVDMRYHNEKLGLLLPVTLQTLNQVDANEAAFHLGEIAVDHPVLKVFQGKTLEAMRRIRFHSLYSVEPRPGRDLDVLMRFGNGFPALVASGFGKGRVFLFTSSLDRDWNDFPIQPSFLPWMQRWVKYAAQDLDRTGNRNLSVGEAFQLENAEPPLLVTVPGGGLRQLDVAAGEPAVFRDTWWPGTYGLYHSPEKVSADPAAPPDKLPEGAKQLAGFTVNVDLRESTGGKVSEDEIRRLLPGTSVEFLAPDALAGSPGAEGVSLITPLFLLMALMLLGEGWMVRRE